MKRVMIVEGRPCGTINLGRDTLRGTTKPTTTTSTKLNRIAKLSSMDAEMEVKWLMPHFNKASLIGCFHELNGKKAVGIYPFNMKVLVLSSENYH